MAAEDAETARTAARTYIPAYQKDEWQQHADELDMSLSEFIRTMVQAGRRGFAGGSQQQQADGSETESAKSAATGDLEQRVISVLESSEPLSWEELLTAVTGDIESQLDETLQELQSRNRIQYSGRDGGYVLGER